MSFWNDERVEALTNLWQAGLSGSQIAKALGGTTRNAVIGKVHREGLANLARAIPAAPKGVKTSKPKRAAFQGDGQRKSMKVASLPPPRPFTHRVAEVVPQPVSLFERTKFQCSVILDGYEEVTCCGAAVARQGFCAGHAVIMLSDKQPRILNEDYFASVGRSLPRREPRLRALDEAA